MFEVAPDGCLPLFFFFFFFLCVCVCDVLECGEAAQLGSTGSDLRWPMAGSSWAAQTSW